MTFSDLAMWLDDLNERNTPEAELTEEQYDARNERVEFALNSPPDLQGDAR